MITIGIGNCKGGVGSSMLCYQLAALLQREGCSVVVAETSITGSDLHWCRGRSIRERRILNCTMESVGYLFIDDFADLREAPRWISYDYVLLDYTNARQDIEAALRSVQHWICPLRPHEQDPTLLAYGTWCELRRYGSFAADSFSAVMNLVPNAQDIEEEPAYADPRFTGDHTLEVFKRDVPLMKVLQRRILSNRALEDNFDGRDIFSQPSPEAKAGREDIQAVWDELLQHWKQGGEPKVPPRFPNWHQPPKLDKFKRYMIGAPFETRRWPR